MKRVMPAALMLLVVACVTVARADITKVRTLLGKRELRLSPSSVFDGSRVLVPLSILEPLGASYSESSMVAGPTRVISAAGSSGEVPTVYIDGSAMLPLDDLLKVTGGEAAFDEGKRTVKLTTHLQSVEFVGGMLKINCSFPITNSVHKWENKVVVDLSDTRVVSEAKEVYIGSELVSKARLGQPEEDRARVVLDLAKDAGYRLHSGQLAAQVLLEVGSNIASPAPAAKPAAAPMTPVKQPYTIDDVRLETLDDDRFCVVIGTSSKAEVSSTYSVDPPSVALKFARATLTDSVAALTETHPLLASLKFDQVSRNPAVVSVALNLNRIAAYDVRVDDREVVLTVRLPDKAGGTLADKLIVIDPGHGGREKGARFGENYEKDVNLRIARALVAALQQEGAQTKLTRGGDETVSLAARPGTAVTANADLFISIHCNSNSVANSASGIETYYHMYESSPRALAHAVHEGVCAATGMCDRKARTDRSLYSSGLAVLRHLSGSGIPGILLECGYLNSSSDRARLLNQAYREKLAAGILRGLKAYIEGTPLR